MSEPSSEILSSFPDLLSKVSYQFAIPCEPDEFELPTGTGFHAEVAFRSPDTKGAIGIYVTTKFSNELAESMLGEESDSLESQVGRDSVGELVNIIAGQILPAAYGAEVLFELSAPNLNSIEPNQWKTIVNLPNVTCFLVEEEHPVIVELKV